MAVPAPPSSRGFGCEECQTRDRVVFDEIPFWDALRKRNNGMTTAAGGSPALRVPKRAKPNSLRLERNLQRGVQRPRRTPGERLRGAEPHLGVGAEGGTRTPTTLRSLGPEPSASANSATSARTIIVARRHDAVNRVLRPCSIPLGSAERRRAATRWRPNGVGTRIPRFASECHLHGGPQQTLFLDRCEPLYSPTL